MKSGSVQRSMQADSYDDSRKNLRPEAVVAASQGWTQAQDAFFHAQRIAGQVQRRVEQSLRNIGRAKAS